MPRTPMPKQAIRLSKEKWDRLGAAADTIDADRSEVIRQLVDWFLRERGAVLPERPPRES